MMGTMGLVKVNMIMKGTRFLWRMWVIIIRVCRKLVRLDGSALDPPEAKFFFQGVFGKISCQLEAVTFVFAKATLRF